MKKKLSILLSLLFLLPVVSSLGGCSAKTQVLRVYNWEEYIDEGGKGSYGDDYLGLGKNAPSIDRKSTRLNSSHTTIYKGSRMPSSA